MISSGLYVCFVKNHDNTVFRKSENLYLKTFSNLAKRVHICCKVANVGMDFIDFLPQD